MKISKLIMPLLGLTIINDVETSSTKQPVCFFSPCGDSFCSQPGFIPCEIFVCRYNPDTTFEMNVICCDDVRECKKWRRPRMANLEIKKEDAKLQSQSEKGAENLLLQDQQFQAKVEILPKRA